MIREVKNNKFGVGSKLELEIITESGDSIKQTHPVEVDQLLKGKTLSCFKTSNVKFRPRRKLRFTKICSASIRDALYE